MYEWVGNLHIFKYARENVAILRTFIKDPYYTSITKDEKIGNTGGLLGLSIGLSALHSVQSVYSKCSFIWFVSSLNLAGWSVNANFNKCALLNSNVCVLSLFIYIIVGGYRIFNE